MEDVLLRFHPNFNYIRRQQVEVRFTMNRAALRIFHQGLSRVLELPTHTLFPPESLEAVRMRPPRPHNLRIFNPSVANNEAQRNAVLRIVEGEARAVPYILFGPPGTGKTTTVVEAVLQCNRLSGKSGSFRCLVCAPTNTAADLLCSRIGKTKIDKLRMLRMMAYSRSVKEVPADVLGFSNYSEPMGVFSTPNVDEILSKSIVVATLSTAGKLTNIGVPRGHFDLILIDESGQALEPEAVAPVATLLDPDGQLVLAGDPKQLGPVIHNMHAKEHGLATSLLERLMTRPLYHRDDNGKYNPLVLTKLVQSFRSHEELLQLPNELFYDGDMECCASKELRYHCCGPEYNQEPLDTKGHPMIFHGIAGKDEREGNSPSWFNKHECIQVLDYTKALLRVRGKPVTPKDIGIITPYNKQAQKLTRLLKASDVPCGAGGVKVGSTELFQGQERKVIIISTVRSSADHIGFDVKHNLGFLSNPKRFNVAITRACSLMIIVGNPHVLATDLHWGQLLRTCIEMGVYRGIPPPELPSQLLAAVGDGEIDVDYDFDGGGDADNVHDEMVTLVGQYEQLLLGASEQFQQEGLEMPSWEG